MALKWIEYLQCARVRAAEEVDSKARFWSSEEVREINDKAKPFSPKNPEPYLRRRSELMLATAKSLETLNQLASFQVPQWVKMLGWIGAFFLGAAVSFLGQDREVNLLALPILFIIAWNFGVILVSLIFGKKILFFQELVRAVFKEKKVKRLSHDEEIGDLGLLKRLHLRFKEIVRPVNEKRFYHKCKHWLHLAAALLAFGTMTGMYVNGWSKDYRAVWESSILSSKGAQMFLGTLFYPASKVSGIEVPLEQIPEMQRTASSPALQSTSALPWIHLYAITIFLFIVLPRLLMVLWEVWSVAKVTQDFHQEKGWRQYLDLLFTSLDGEGAPATVLLYGVQATKDVEREVRRAAKRYWQDVGVMKLQSVAPGNDFAEDLSKLELSKRTLVVFNMAQTPETEVHQAWLAGLSQELEKAFEFYTLAVALDEGGLRKSWGGFTDGREKIRTRRESWGNRLSGVKFEWLSLDPES